jgi:hypothetical protein
MGRFIDTKDEGTVNLDHVVSFTTRHQKNGKCWVTFRFSNGEGLFAEIYPGMYDRLTNLELGDDERRLIPASPGYWILRYWADDKTRGEDIDREQVIAWMIDTEGEFHVAIGPFSRSSEDHTAVLCPTGEVIELGSQKFKDEAAWIESERAEQKRTAA